MVASHVRPWNGVGFHHIPAGAPFGVLDTRFAGRAADNRWNEPGDPTLYIAGDRAIAIAEFARHLREDFSPTLRSALTERSLYRLELGLQAVLDLRDSRVSHALGLPADAYRFLDRAYARATATFVRRTTAARALLVPSIAFLDDLSRWNLVLFLEKLPADLSGFIQASYDGAFRLEAD